MLNLRLSKAFSTAGSLLTWGETTYGWGRPVNKNLYNPGAIDGFKSVTSVSTGPYHLAFLTENHSLYTVGLGSHGRLGHGSETTLQSPEKVISVGSTNDKIVSVACGSRHTLAVTQSGTLYSWGFGGGKNPLRKMIPFLTIASPLGHVSQADSLTPSVVESIPETVTQATAGEDFSIAVGGSGTVYGWGEGLKKLTIQQTPVPVPIESINELLHRKHTSIKKITAVGQFLMFLCDNGKMYAYGVNNGGVFGTRPNSLIITDDRLYIPTPVITEEFHGESVVDFEVSANSMICKTSAGKVFYSGMHLKYKPSPFPVAVDSASKIWATYDSVGVVTGNNKVYFLNDKFIDKHYKEGNVFVAEDPNLSKPVLKMGGSHYLRYAIVA